MSRLESKILLCLIYVGPCLLPLLPLLLLLPPPLRRVCLAAWCIQNLQHTADPKAAVTDICMWGNASGHLPSMTQVSLCLSVFLAKAHPLDDEVVVATAETTVTGEHHQQHILHWADLAQRAVHILHPQALVNAIQHLQEQRNNKTQHTCMTSLTAFLPNGHRSLAAGVLRRQQLYSSNNAITTSLAAVVDQKESR
jgi:hypothetical protein